MSHVFISYKRENLKFAQQIEKQFESAGIRTWYFPQIKAGEEWRTTIDTAIQKCFALVVVMTPQARQSEYVTYEWSFALGLGIPIVPVLLEPTSLHPKLETLQYIDFSARFEEPWDRLIERLLELQRQALFKLEGIDPTEMFFDRTGNELIRLKLSTNVEDLIAYLKNPDVRVRRTAIGALGTIGGDTVVNSILPMLADPELSVRSRAISSLAKIGNPVALPNLVHLALHDENAQIREEALYAIAEFGNAGKLELINIIQHPVPRLRERAIRLVGQYASADVADILLNALADDVSSVREAASQSIIRNFGFAIVTRLGAVFMQAESATKIQIIDILSEIGDKNSRQIMIKAIGDSDTKVVLKALRQLRYWHSSDVIIAVASALDHGNRDVVQTASDVLAQIGSEEASAILAAWRNSSQ
jgi:HEAT repeat protein